VSENRVLRRILGPRRAEVVGGWRRLYNEELHKFYDSRNTVRVITGHVARMGQRRNAYRILVGKPEGRN
jgi:hypothetical protein